MKQTDNINLPISKKYRTQNIEVNMYRGADEKISKTENDVKVANCDVENLDH